MIKEFHESKNLFSGYTIGIGINPTTGVQELDRQAAASGYIEINSTKTYTFSGLDGNLRSFVNAYNTDKQSLGRTSATERTTITFDSTSFTGGTPQGTGEIKYIRLKQYQANFSQPDITDINNYNIMLNEGQTALPYEPYGDTWNTKSYAKSISGAQTYTKFPIVLRTTQQSIPTWSVKGNMVQNGTPTPTSPITPSECGERTENILPRPAIAKTETVGDITFSLDSNGTLTVNGSTGENSAVFYYDLASDFTFPTSKQKGGDAYLYYWNTFAVNGVIRFFYNDTFIDYWSILPVNRVISQFDNLENVTVNRIKVEIPANSTITNGKISLMVTNDGNQATQFEPYGYKLPIVSGGVTTNVYLGQVQSTRIIGKYEFTGQENWIRTSTNYFYSISPFTNYDHKLIDKISTVWSHYIAAVNNTNGQHLSNGYSCLYCHPSTTSVSEAYIRDERYSTAADFKTYLQQQYSNGTPVTVWYVLATETTGIVNEPLRKIGDYVDVVSNPVSIPTTSGLNTIDVATTLKPSEMSLTYDGYKLCKGQRYSRTENLFDGVIEQGSITNDGDIDSELRVRSKNYIPISGLQYTISATGNANKVLVYTYNENKNILYNTSWENIPYSTSDSNVKYIRIIFKNVVGGIDQNISPADVSNVMVNTGSTAKPYQPYLDWE